ncbi:uncharacterized protein LOC109824578 [Asparagus officinalis]|nr:uncharacterized protein LOC109824578 [Asparagus officinalis]
MTSVLSSHPPVVQIHENSSENSFMRKLNKVQYLGHSSVGYSSGGALSTQRHQFISVQAKVSYARQFVARAVSNDAEPSNDDDASEKKESSESKNEEIKGGMSREELERLIGQDDSAFSGVDLATLIRKKYGRSYDVQLIKKEFMGKNLLAMNVMWKYVEQRSFPLTEEEYLLRLDDVANTLKCWGAVSHIRNSLEKLKERPRIGKAVSIFIDMDESGGRAKEWIYK